MFNKRSCKGPNEASLVVGDHISKEVTDEARLEIRQVEAAVVIDAVCVSHIEDHFIRQSLVHKIVGETVTDLVDLRVGPLQHLKGSLTHLPGRRTESARRTGMQCATERSDVQLSRASNLQTRTTHTAIRRRKLLTSWGVRVRGASTTAMSLY